MEYRVATRIALVSCVKKKRGSAAFARDLYLSQLFRGLRCYAESHADVWYILSAEHGLLKPDQIVEPYERTLRCLGFCGQSNSLFCKEEEGRSNGTGKAAAKGSQAAFVH